MTVLFALLLLQSARPLQAPADFEVANQNRAIAGCVLKRDGTAPRLLSSVPGSADSVRIVKAIASKVPTCEDDGSWVTIRDSALRGGIAEQLLVGDGIARPVPFIMPSADVRAKLPQAQQSELAVIAAGECVGSADPATAKALAATKVGTIDEAARFNDLAGALARCGLPTDVTRVRLLRDYVMEGTYRVAFTRSETK